jgi:hypothetical protein
MLLHASAFGIFLMISLFYYIALCFYLFQPFKDAYIVYFTWAAITYSCGSFISQALLCAIFQDLSVRIKEMPMRIPAPKKVKPQVTLVKYDNKIVREISKEDQETD